MGCFILRGMMGGFRNEYRPDDCKNCGKKARGVMGSSEWGHDYLCCSDACGIRLGKKISNEMLCIERYTFPTSIFREDKEPWKTERIKKLRNRIKYLEWKNKVVK